MNGINKFNAIVGSALNPSTNRTFGFKYKNGAFTKIRYPGAVQTTAIAINDNGVIVGAYQNGAVDNPWHGYILQNGVYKSLSYIPSDINHWGTTVENNLIHYPDGSSKGVYVSGSSSTFVNGINDNGVITGGATWGSFEFRGFTAKCR